MNRNYYSEVLASYGFGLKDGWMQVHAVTPVGRPVVVDLGKWECGSLDLTMADVENVCRICETYQDKDELTEEAVRGKGKTLRAMIKRQKLTNMHKGLPKRPEGLYLNDDGRVVLESLEGHTNRRELYEQLEGMRKSLDSFIDQLSDCNLMTLENAKDAVRYLDTRLSEKNLIFEISPKSGWLSFHYTDPHGHSGHIDVGTFCDGMKISELLEMIQKAVHNADALDSLWAKPLLSRLTEQDEKDFQNMTGLNEKTQVYLSTAMTGVSHEDVDAKLDMAERALITQGCECIRPVMNIDLDLDHKIKMLGQCIAQMEGCHMLVFVGDVGSIAKSKGCKVELMCARAYDLRIRIFETKRGESGGTSWTLRDLDEEEIINALIARDAKP